MIYSFSSRRILITSFSASSDTSSSHSITHSTGPQTFNSIIVPLIPNLVVAKSFNSFNEIVFKILAGFAFGFSPCNCKNTLISNFK